jgi:N-acetylneuraminate synthase
MRAPKEALWGPGQPPFIIAEVGLTHEGSLGNALAFIDACADAGANAVKFQCHDGDENVEFRANFDWPQDDCRQAYWERTRFALTEWQDIYAHAQLRRIALGITPFSLAALWLVHEMCDFLKIARQHCRKLIHDKANLTNRRVLFTGPHGGLGLNEYDPARHIGISDHSASIAPAVDAFKRGAEVAELHVCFDRRQFGPDVSMSVTIDELAELVRAVK